ncbi:MAG: UrcA family protein [Gammaproteobacteria bacterium]
MNKLSRMNLTAALALAIASVAGAHLAYAGNDTDSDRDVDSPKKVLVHYADLNMVRSTGAAVLYRRLQSAAEKVCTPINAKDASHQVMFRHCVADAMARAVTEVDQPALGAYYRAKLEGRNAITAEATARK